ncbi:hypothetical protein HanRHA438_Chr04g0198411 [Helianthus annuus]|nr:hypothetical protein HanRHA438_Chr04g0198411 [Helianthus annuus]
MDFVDLLLRIVGLVECFVFCNVALWVWFFVEMFVNLYMFGMNLGGLMASL